MDPITKEMDKKPLKPFMVNQLQIAFERDRLILSPWDDVLKKQLTDYEVEKITEAGVPKYTSENEHFVDALGLAYLAMVLEFKNITGTVEEIKVSSKVKHINKKLAPQAAIADTTTRTNLDPRIQEFYSNTDFSEREGDRQQWVKVDIDYRSARSGGTSSRWGSRSIGSGGGFRRSW